MKVHAAIRQQVEVDPIEFLQELRDGLIGRNSWVFREDGKYYKGFEKSAGAHSSDEKVEIKKGDYLKVKAIEYLIDSYKEKVYKVPDPAEFDLEDPGEIRMGELRITLIDNNEIDIVNTVGSILVTPRATNHIILKTGK